MVENPSPVLANRRSQNGAMITTTTAATAALVASHAATMALAATHAANMALSLSAASKAQSQSRENLLFDKDAPSLPPKPGKNDYLSTKLRVNSRFIRCVLFRILSRLSNP